MKCEEAEVLLHALIDGELDAGHAREVEEHVAACPHCAARLREFTGMRQAMNPAALRFAAPQILRSRIEGKLPATEKAASRRSVIKGFAIGATASALAASGLLVMVLRQDDDRRQSQQHGADRADGECKRDRVEREKVAALLRLIGNVERVDHCLDAGIGAPDRKQQAAGKRDAKPARGMRDDPHHLIVHDAVSAGRHETGETGNMTFDRRSLGEQRIARDQRGDGGK